jgi:hypothetical protein
MTGNRWKGFFFQARPLPLWRVALILAGALAAAAAAMVLIGGVLLVALPVALIAVLAYRLLGRPSAPDRTRGGPRVIEGEYIVMTDDDTRAPHDRTRLPRDDSRP